MLSLSGPVTLRLELERHSTMISPCVTLLVLHVVGSPSLLMRGLGGIQDRDQIGESQERSKVTRKPNVQEIMSIFTRSSLLLTS